MRAFIFAALSVAVFSAHAQVSGTYKCQNRIKSTVVANGKSKKVSSVSSSQVTYFADGTFQGRTPISPYISNGTWSQQGRKIFMSPNMDDAARDALYGCQLTGANCILIGVIGNSAGRVGPGEKSIRGTANLRLSMIVNGIMANSTAVNEYTCSR